MGRNIILLLAILVVCFIIIELAYRILDPFPYFGWWEINHTEHGNLSQYDEVLGWKGVPDGRAYFVTDSNKVLLQNNRSGFRDIEHKADFIKKEVVVFLGDSFTWGHKVNFDEMFVNILRTKLWQYEIFNLSHRGHGTDQQLLTFKQWHYNGPIKLVILVFSENDFDDNNSTYASSKFKPKYEFYDNRLILTNIPVPKEEGWIVENAGTKITPSAKDRLKWLILQSHFINDIRFRVRYFQSIRAKEAYQNKLQEENDDEYFLTKQIIRELQDDVIKREGRLIVIAIPSKKQFMRNSGYIPYQLRVEKICKSLNIDYLDLAATFKKAFFRTYYREGSHLNKYGNKLVAKAVYNYLKDK